MYWELTTDYVNSLVLQILLLLCGDVEENPGPVAMPYQYTDIKVCHSLLSFTPSFFITNFLKFYDISFLFLAIFVHNSLIAVYNLFQKEKIHFLN